MRKLDELIHYLEQIGEAEQANKLRKGETIISIKNIFLGSCGVIQFAKAIESNAQITQLKLVNIGINNEGAEKFANALKTNKKLNHLTLEDILIQEQGASKFAEALEYNNTLTYFDLKGNTLERSEENQKMGGLIFSPFDVRNLDGSISRIGGNTDFIQNATLEKIKEKILFNKSLVEKLALLISSYINNKEDTSTAFKVLAAGKFYKVVDKVLLKSNLITQGIQNSEQVLENIEKLISTNLFTVVGACKNTKQIELPDEIWLHINFYLNDWNWEVKTTGATG